MTTADRAFTTTERAQESTLRAGDGVALQLRRWPGRAAGPSRGTVLIVHGLGEHAGRHAALAEAISAAGWSVIGYDQRGHGRSEGARGGLPSDDSLLEDLGLVVDAARAVPTGSPLVLFGHSMGGLVAARFVAEGLSPPPARWHRDVAGLVLSSPALDVALSAPQRVLLAATAPLVPGLALGNGLKPEWISHDASVVRAYIDDPLVHDRITPRLARFIVVAGQTVRERAPAWRVPTLLLWAGADRCVSPSGSQAFAAAAPVSVVEHQVWPAMAHEIFHEPEREDVTARLLRWLDAHAAPRERGYSARLSDRSDLP